MKQPFKPLDFVKTKCGNIGIVSEVNESQPDYWTCSVDFIEPNTDLKSAWWTCDEIEVVNNLPRMLSLRLCHPFGSGKELAKNSY